MLRYDIEDGLQEYLNDKLDIGVKTVMASQNDISYAYTLVIVTRENYYELVYHNKTVYNMQLEKQSDSDIVVTIKEFMKDIQPIRE